MIKRLSLKKALLLCVFSLAVALAAAIAAPVVLAAGEGTSNSCGEGLTWVYEGATLTITKSGDGTGAMKDYALGDYAPWHSYSASIKTVVINEGVTRIGNDAFWNCTGLTSITFPDSVTSIGDNAFQNCESLTRIGNLASVTRIGNNAFFGCSGLTGITIPASVTSLGKLAFYGCTGLTSITIPASVMSIGEYAFQECRGLTSIRILASLESIDTGTFQNCASLTSITIPASVTSIGDVAFSGCAGLANVEFLGGNPPTLGEGAFWGVPSGLSVTVPVGKAAYYTTALSGKLPDGATIIEKSPDQIPDETDLLPPIPSEPSTPSIPPVVVPADTASGSTSGAKLEMKASQLPSGVEASDVTFVAKAVEAATAPAQVVSAPAKFAAATLASIPNLPTAKSITVYDLDLLLKSSGEKVDFTGKVTVSIPMPAGYGSFLRVFHVADDGAMTEVPAVINGSNILLTLEHFSHYAVVDFASPAGKLPAKLTASATVTTAATTAKPSEGGSNAGKNPTTGAMLPLLAIIGCAGAGAVTMKTRRK